MNHAVCLIHLHKRGAIDDIEAVKHIAVYRDDDCEEGKYHPLKLISWHNSSPSFLPETSPAVT
jgi:hypothetical protein